MLFRLPIRFLIFLPTITCIILIFTLTPKRSIESQKPINITPNNPTVPGSTTLQKSKKNEVNEEVSEELDLTNWRQLTQEQIDSLSTLGRILYLDEVPPKIEQSKKYQILIWKHYNDLLNRHLKNYKSEYADPFAQCSVRNCEIVGDDKFAKTADLVIFHLQRLSAKDPLPTERPLKQIWAFLTDETPYHTFQTRNALKNYNGVFNWSMTYRMDSDIPVPYGRTVVRKNCSEKEENYEYNKRRDILITVLASNCGGQNHRWEYVAELRKYIEVDFYGYCGYKQTSCPGHFTANCDDIDNYMFYLSFENSNCRDYLTEKVWWNAYSKNSIPIVMGATKENYRQHLPPGSYLNVDDFNSPKDLANFIKYLNNTEEYRNYYKWKKHFEIRNEHGYFQSQSFHYCRACEALNYNSRETKVYGDLGQFWNKTTDCYDDWMSRI